MQHAAEGRTITSGGKRDFHVGSVAANWPGLVRHDQHSVLGGEEAVETSDDGRAGVAAAARTTRRARVHQRVREGGVRVLGRGAGPGAIAGLA